MKYYVTGATGFIGGRVVRQLIEAGHQVIAPVRTPAKAKDLAALGANVVQGDVTDKESMRPSMAGVDGVFHLAGWYKLGVRDKSMGVSINVDGTRNVLELMKELNIPKGVYTSTLAVHSNTRGRVVDESYHHEDDGHWVSEYDHTKWRAHYEVAEPMIKAGLPLVIVMPGLVYGPGDTSTIHETFVQYLQRKLPMVPEKTTYCWAYVDDIARGHILAMEKGKPGESYIIAGPEARVVEVLALAEKITGVPAPRLQPPLGVIRIMTGVMGIVEKIVPVPPTYSSEGLRVLTATYLGSNAKAKRELGYTLRPLEEGLRETLYYEMRQLSMKIPTGDTLQV